MGEYAQLSEGQTTAPASVEGERAVWTNCSSVTPRCRDVGKGVADALGEYGYE